MDIEALAYVKDYLAAHGEDVRPGQGFRTRLSHMERVCLWVERLTVAGGVEHMEALRLAAAMHDVGYARQGTDEHARYSVEILRAYAAERDIDRAVADRAAWLVAEHSYKKRWLHAPDAPRDLITLMEADLLDEEGAMGIALDCMTAGAMQLDYRGAYDRMQKFEPPRLAKNPMVTPLARHYWEWKQRIIREFMTAYAFDLGLDQEEA